MANFTKNKTKPTTLRNYSIYPMGSSGMSVVFLNQTTMVFGDREAAVEAAWMPATASLPTSSPTATWSTRWARSTPRLSGACSTPSGTQTMMKGVLGDAAQLADYDTVKNRMKSSRYTMDFQNGVKFDMAVVMSDTITAATAATLMKGVSIMRKTSGSAA